MRNSFGDVRTVPLTMWWRKVPLSRTVPNTKIRGRDGAVPVGGNSLEPREFTLEGTLQAPQDVPKDEARRLLVRDFDDLLGFVSGGEIEITRSGWDDRVLKAQFTGGEPEWHRSYTEVTISWTFRADDPYWHSWRTAEDARELVNEQVFVVSTVGGNAPIHPLVRFRGRGSGTANPNLFNMTTGEGLNFVGTIPTGQVLEIDTARSHATLNGAGAVSKMAPIPFFWTLKPGLNRLRYVGPPMGLYLNWRERWL